jgi:hypothetical protein
VKLLEYKDIKMTQRYSHHCPESLRGVEVLDKVTTVLQQSMKKGLCLTHNPLLFLVEQRGNRTPDLKTARMKRQKTITP